MSATNLSKHQRRLSEEIKFDATKSKKMKRRRSAIIKNKGSTNNMEFPLEDIANYKKQLDLIADATSYVKQKIAFTFDIQYPEQNDQPENTPNDDQPIKEEEKKLNVPLIRIPKQNYSQMFSVPLSMRHLNQLDGSKDTEKQNDLRFSVISPVKKTLPALNISSKVEGRSKNKLMSSKQNPNLRRQSVRRVKLTPLKSNDSSKEGLVQKVESQLIPLLNELHLGPPVLTFNKAKLNEVVQLTKNKKRK